MDKLSLFKEFVKKNPSLIKYVKNGEMTWQKFYEIYDLYEEDESAWREYTVKENNKTNNKTNNNTVKAATGLASAAGITDIFSWLKNIDLDTVKEGAQNLQRVIGVVQDFSTKDETVKPKEEYRPRPLYKHFED